MTSKTHFRISLHSIYYNIVTYLKQLLSSSRYKQQRQNEMHAQLLSSLRSAVSVGEGLRETFQLFCRITEAERGILISSGPLVIEESPKPHVEVLDSWPVRHFSPEGNHNIAITQTNLCIRVVAPVRHQGDIGILVHYPRKIPATITRMYRRVLENVMQTAAAMIEVDHGYRSLLRALPYDPLTHLPIWSMFRDLVVRRLPRLDRESLPATLMLVSFSGLMTMGDGPPNGDYAEEQISHVRDAIQFLQGAIRPTDIIGQIDRESYILWLDGGDRFASVERAEQICRRRYQCAAGAKPIVKVKIGLVTREPQSTDSLDVFFERARIALTIAQEDGTDWHFAHENA